ncbi:hypothetical protein [uncultured Bradyrhizobium sp.]|uniref:hypothetical protein n=1 Tax=uncultured Bradyrhizobium sp. TaxID=199684 RepID=UPI002635B9D5|nr:hypothetical protein [uncultured Bradyrhizobium sp.]
MGTNIVPLDAHPKTLNQQQKIQCAKVQRGMDAAKASLDLAGCAMRHDLKTRRRNHEERKPMSDESALERAAARAARAEALCDDEILNEAFAALENSYIAAWRATSVDDAAGREKLFLAINIVGKVRDHLAGVVANGKLARAELKELAETAERRKRFGII